MSDSANEDASFTDVKCRLVRFVRLKAGTLVFRSEPIGAVTSCIAQSSLRDDISDLLWHHDLTPKKQSIKKQFIGTIPTAPEIGIIGK